MNFRKLNQKSSSTDNRCEATAMDTPVCIKNNLRSSSFVPIYHSVFQVLEQAIDSNLELRTDNGIDIP